MIRDLWKRHRRTVVITVTTACAVLAATVTVLALLAGNGGKARTTTRQNHAAPVTTPATHRPSASQPGSEYHPHYVVPPATARQDQLASALASAESPQQIAAVEALSVPAGGYSTDYPAIPAAATSDELTYANTWTTELLDIDYRAQSRSALLAWAVEGEAANTLPGVPSNVEDKALYASLSDPTLGGQSGTSPVPSPSHWAANAKAGVVQRASGIETSVDPQWTTLVSEGFVPTDPLLAFVDISGTLTTRQPHQTTVTVTVPAHGKNTKPSTKTVTRTVTAVSTVQFKAVLTVGSALHHPGYGAVSVDGWTVT